MSLNRLPHHRPPLEPADGGARLLDEVKGWNETRVADWLQTVNSAKYAGVFVSNHINGDALLECDQTALRELGITKVGDRVRILVAVKALRRKCFGDRRPQSIADALSLDRSPSFASSSYSPSSASASSIFTTTSTNNNGNGNSSLAPNGALNVSSPSQSTHSPASSISIRTPTVATSSAAAAAQPVGSRTNNASAVANVNPGLSPTRNKNTGGETGDSPVRNANGISSLLQNCVKFIGEEGQTRIVNIHGCTDPDTILEKALKKFGLTEAITMDPSDRPDNYCVFITADVGPARQLELEELFHICQDSSRPERERLILKKRDTAPSILEFRQAQKIAREQQALLKDQAIANNMGKLKKIGGFFGEMPSHIRSGSGVPSPPALASPPLQTPRGPKARIKEFFGGRPPSELISSNLQDYFPEASTSVLEKTVRNSIRRSQRISIAARGGGGGGGQLGGTRRPSNASLMSISSYKGPSAPIPSVGDAWISAAMQTRKSIAPSLHRSSSVSSRADTIKSRRSLRSRYEPEATLAASTSDSRYEPSVRSMRSTRSVSIREPGGSRSRRDSSCSSSDAVSEGDYDTEDDTLDGGEYDLPDYLKEKLALTADDDEPHELERGIVDTSNARALSVALGLGDDVEANGGLDVLVASINAENTGPSSWIKGTLIGQGSFGSVVLGMNALTGELMAVKQVDLPRNPGDVAARKSSMLDALQREIALLRDLQHDNIVQYLGSNSDRTHLNIFLEYVPGGSVTEMLTKYGAFKEPLVRQFVRQILAGLNYLHEREIIHRDIKGGNILVDNKGVIKISDFGISKKVDTNMLSMHESAMSKNAHRPSLQGSVFWMAPEVVKQTQYTRKADIWSLGCLIVEMFTGQHPYPEFNQMQAIFKIGGTDSAPEIPPDISADGKDFLSKTFELDFTQRPTADELLVHKFCHASVA